MPKVIIIEDDDDHADLTARFAHRSGHEVIGTADTPKKTKALIATLGAQAGLAILDMDFEGDTTSIFAVVAQLRSQNPEVKIIGNCIDANVPGADRQARKDYKVLGDILDSCR